MSEETEEIKKHFPSTLTCYKDSSLVQLEAPLPPLSLDPLSPALPTPSPNIAIAPKAFCEKTWTDPMLFSIDWKHITKY